MNDLHLALFALGALLLLAVYVNGKWQERRLLRRLRDRLHGGLGDALLQAGSSIRERDEVRIGDVRNAAARPQAGRVDPGFAEEHALADVGPSTVPAAPYTEPAREELSAVAPAAASAAAPLEYETIPPDVTSERLRAPSALLRPDWAEDPLLDCTLELRCARALDGVSVIDAAATLGHSEWQLPVHFVVWDGRHQQWVLPDRFGYYTDALASIQLANRHAKIDEAELLRFVQSVQQVAAALDADVDAPDPARLLLQAQELDRLCARFDIKIGLTVESTGGAWTGPQLRSAAQQAHFVATDAQRWVHCDAQGEPLYTLQADPVLMNRLTLEFDIALAPVAARAFRAMVDSATSLAASLGGRVVDDNGDPIEASSMDAIEAQLVRMYAEMNAAGIEPGSTRARRLYA